MKRYEEYKDSGVAWLGDIPVSWDIIMAKHVVSINHGSDPKSEGDIPVYGSGAGSFKTCGEYKEGPIVLVGRKGATLHIPHYIEGKYWNVDTAFDVKSKEGTILIKLYYYLAQCFDYRYYISQTTLPSMTQSDYCEMKLPIPDIIEQRGIVEYLDSIVAYIDILIDEAKASIEEYKAWKASIIYEAVTKGLDKNAEMKDSGVEWIGEIPSDWTVMRLRFLISGYKAGPFGSALITDRLNPQGKILVYTPEHIAKKTTDLDKNLYLPEERKDEMSQFIVEAGDVIFPIVGSLGRSMLITEDMPVGIINQRLAKFRLDTNTVLMDYFLWLFSKSDFYSTYIDLHCRGSIIVNLTKQIVSDMPIVFPSSLGEQRKICYYLEEKCGEIDSLISEKESLISDLEAYKKSLIFETVTGKRKVV